MMEFVLGILMAYVLCGSIWPQIVRNRQFFLIGAGLVVLALLLTIVPLRFPERLAEVPAFAFLVLAASGGTFNEWWKQIFG
jgi:hypothetical protein